MDVRITLKKRIQKRKLYIDLQAILYLHAAHLINQKINENIIEEKTGKYELFAHSNCNLNYKIPKEIPVVFHNGSTYDYHFIIKQLAREFKGYFHCLGENTEKYITFSVPIKKRGK